MHGLNQVKPVMSREESEGHARDRIFQARPAQDVCGSRSYNLRLALAGGGAGAVGHHACAPRRGQGGRQARLPVHALVKERPGRAPLATIKVMKENSAEVESQAEEIK